MDTLEEMYASLMVGGTDKVQSARVDDTGADDTLEDMYTERVREYDEVLAANPYGCNQYGEGWKMPHNGLSRVPRGSKPKGGEPKGGETGGNSGSSGGADRNEAVRLSPEMHNKLVGVVGEDAVERFYDQMNKAPEDIRAFWEKHKGWVTDFQKTKGTSNLSYKTISINPNSMTKKDWRHEGGVLFHEIGHALDMSCNRNGENFNIWGHESIIMHEAIKKDFDRLVELKKEQMLNEAKELLNKHGGKITNELLDDLVKAGKMSEDSKSAYLRGNQAMLPDAILLAQGIKKIPGLGRVSIKKSSAGYWIAKDIANGNPLVKGVVCDAIISKPGCYDEIDVGHNKTYYKQWDGNADAMETFANLYAGYALNDKKIMDEVEKLLPETTKAFKNILKKGR